ncbi:MAG: hypothetical protein E6J74_35045 [Deltaproteobacteria bacterium]|nr:MAG: hypothetical protein E6J74_35045 [Deltaproteobacteria bacterium]
MKTGFQYIQPLYGYKPDIAHIAVPENCESALEIMAADLLGTDGLIAIYIPEGTEEVYEPGVMRGRVVGGVRLLPMPPGKEMRDYFYPDWDKRMRWPLGWPCKAVYAPPVSECRPLVDDLFGQDLFQSYVSRFQHGPFKLEAKMAKELDKFFAQFSKVRTRKN